MFPSRVTQTLSFVNGGYVQRSHRSGEFFGKSNALNAEDNRGPVSPDYSTGRRRYSTWTIPDATHPTSCVGRVTAAHYDPANGQTQLPRSGLQVSHSDRADCRKHMSCCQTSVRERPPMRLVEAVSINKIKPRVIKKQKYPYKSIGVVCRVKNLLPSGPSL